MSADPSSPHGVPVTSPSGGTASAADGLTPPLASPSEGVPVSNPSGVTGNGTLPATLPAATVPVVAIAGTGILLQSDYANGTGRANPHTIDHAVFAEAAATALNVPNLGTAALLDAPPARTNATPSQLVRGDDTRLGTGSSTPGPQGPLGASAYDLAVLNGFVGTQAQWLASLQGAPGPAGANGAGGDMLSSVYAVGAGQANAHPVDHAQYADLAGVVPYAAVTGKPTLGTASPLDVAPSGNASASQAVKGNDTRLSDARTPSSHSSSHAANGSDPVSIANTQVTGLGNASTLTAPSAGVNATSVQAVKGDDTRLSNARTPTAHAASHAAGGGDPLTLTKAQISDFPGVVGDMAKATYDANNDGVVDRALLADSASAVSYANVTGKPSTFAPSPHAASHGSGSADAVTVANTQVTGLGTASVKDVPSSGDASSSQVVYGTDSRLTNARTPTAHTHPLAQVTDAGTSASHDVAPSGNASAAQVVLGNDGRLSDSRTPLAHAATHAFGGSDAVTIVKTQVSDLGTIGTAAAKDIPASGNASTSQVVYGTDTRLSDARTPSAHAATHKSGGSDAIKLDELAAPTDVTTLNVSTSAHGLVPKANGVATNFLDGTGSWSTPAGTGSGGTGDMQQSVYAAGNGSSNTHTVDHAVYADTAPYSGITGTPTLGTAAAKDIPASGNASSTQVVYGSDTRLSDSRTPSAHAASHKSGGSDSIKLDELAATTDVTTLNASTSAHGLMPKGTASTTTFYRSDLTQAALPLNSTSAAGTVAQAPNSVYKFWRGDAAWQPQNSSQLTSASFVMPAVGSAVTVAMNATAWPAVGMYVYAQDGTSRAFLEVTTVTSTTSIALTNRGHAINASSGTTFAVSSLISLVGPAAATATQPGLVPTPPNDATKVLTGAMTYAAVAYANVTGTPTLGTAAAKDVPATGDASSTQVVYGTDTRLTNARTPTAHASSHGNGGSDAVSIVKAQVSDLGTIGTAAAKDIPASGNASSTQVVYGSDTRLTDSRTPSSHAATHLTGGSDVIPAPTTGASGLVPALPAAAGANRLFNGTAAWVGATLTATVTTAFNIPSANSTQAIVVSDTSFMSNGMLLYFSLAGSPFATLEVFSIQSGTGVTVVNRGYPGSSVAGAQIDAGSAAVPLGPGLASATNPSAGLLPTPDNNAAHFLNGQLGYVSVPYASVSGTPTLGTAAAKDVPSSGNASSTQVVYGNDTRLSDSRTPTAHASTHLTAGSDAISLATSVLAGLCPAVDNTTIQVVSSKLSAVSLAYSALTGVPSSFTPSAHAASHKSGGSDAIKLDELSASTDVTTLNASTGAHGLLPKLSGTATQFLNGSGGWATPAGAGDMTKAVYDTANRGYVDRAVLADSASAVAYANVTGKPSTFTPSAHESTHITGGADVIPAPTTSASGLVPLLPASNASNQFLNGAAAFSTVAYSGLTGTPTLGTAAAKDIPASGNASASQVIYGTDTRLSDSRSPTAHAATHASGGGDAVTIVKAQVSDLGTIGTAAAKDIPASGNASGTQVVYGSDTRLTDARTPTSHAATHLAGGGDTIASATATAAGLVPTPPNSTNKWYLGNSTWAYQAQSTETNGTFTVPAAGSTVAVTIVSASWPVVGQTLLITDGTRIGFFEITVVSSATSITVANRGYLGNSTSGTMATASTVRLMGPGIATATQPGFVPTPDNTATHFLNGQMAYTAVPYSSLSGTPSTFSPSAHASSHQSGGGDAIALDTLAVPTDITTLNASTSAHGLMPKGTASTSTFYRSDLTQAAVAYAGVTGTPTLGTAAAKNIPASGNASATEVVYGSDTRLTDARTPAAHAATHLTGGGDTIASATATAAGLVPTPPNNVNKWYKGDSSWSFEAQATETNGTFVVPAAGSTVAVTIVSASWPVVGQTVFITDGTRVGFFEVTVVSSATSVTVANRGYLGNSTSGTMATASIVRLVGPGIATATQAGFVPTPDNTATHFLNGQMGFTAPTYAGLGGTPPALDAVSAPTDITTLNASTSAHGLMPKGTASTTTFYRSDLTQAAVAYSGLSGTPSTFAPSAHETSHITGGSDLIPAPTTSATGLVPALPSTNGSLQVLNGAASFAYPAQTTATNGTFTVPAAGSTVAITIVSASWPVVGQTVFITDGTRVGYFEITVVTSATAITLSNRGYLGNSTSGTMATGSIVQLQAPGLATATQPGFVPVPPNNTTTFLNGQNAYTAVAYSSLSGTPSTFSPSAHASTHQSGGGDAIALDTLAVPTDITTLNASTSVHGLMPKGTASTTTFYRSDLTQATPPTVTRSAAGYAPASGGVSGTTNYLREDLTWAAPSGGTGTAYLTQTNASFTCPAANATVSVTFLSTTGFAVGMGLNIATAGLFSVSSITNSTVAVMLNTGVTGNATSGTIATLQNVYLNGAATNATSTLAGLVPAPPNSSTQFFNGTAAFSTPPTVTSSTAGYAPASGGGTANVLRADLTWTTPPPPKPFATWIAGLMSYPPSTLYATFGTRNNRPYVAFNDSATWTAYCMGFMPTGASLGSGLIVRLKWMGATATTGNVVWGVAIERMTTDQDADSFDTQVTATTATSGTSGIAVETAITITTIDSTVAGDGFIIQVQRLGANGSDTVTGDVQCELISVETVA